MSTVISTENTVKPNAVRRVLGIILSRYAVVLVLVVMCIVFTITNTETFPTLRNLQNVLGDNSILLILALGSLVPLVVGEFDLSIGNCVGISAVVVALLTGQLGWPLLPAVVMALAAGLLMGLINGLMIGYGGISSFIVTLAVGTFVLGMTQLLSNGQVLFSNIPPELLAFGQGSIGPLPFITLLAAVLTVVTWFVLSKTLLGRRFYATGLGREQSRLTGVNTRRLVMIAFLVSGLAGAIGGVLVVGRVGAASPSIGPSYLLPALAAAFLGATVHLPGRFNVIGTIVAILFVGVGLNGLQLNGAAFWVQPAFQGVVLAAAVALSRFTLSRVRRS